MDRRKFLKFAGVSGVFGSLLSHIHPALAQTWQKISNPTGTANTWQKLSIATTTNIIGASDIQSYYYTSVALRSDGFVFTTGSNTYGQLGNNSTNASLTFTQAVGISNIIAVACGYRYSLALNSEGIVYSAGYNNSGQLGIGTTSSRSSFTQVTDF